jgi:hypothetical protein
MKYLILLLPMICNAGEFDLTPDEINLLKAQVGAEVEPYNPKKQWPDIINDIDTIKPPEKVMSDCTTCQFVYTPVLTKKPIILDPSLAMTYDTWVANRIYTKQHNNGWIISATITNDGKNKWIDHFEARHPKYGTVVGDFNKQVVSKTKPAFEDFVKSFLPTLKY